MRPATTRHATSAKTRLALGFAALAAALISGAAAANVTLQPDDPAVVALGSKVYVDQCAACHGDKLEGQTPEWTVRDAEGYLPAPPHDATGHTWHHPDEMLFEITKFGLQKFAGADYRTRMPAYEGVLSDEEIIAVLSYIKSTWPEPVRLRHDGLSDR